MGDIEIARSASLKKITEIAKELNVSQVQISRMETKIIKKIKEGFDWFYA